MTSGRYISVMNGFLMGFAVSSSDTSMKSSHARQCHVGCHVGDGRQYQKLSAFLSYRHDNHRIDTRAVDLSAKIAVGARATSVT